MIIVVTILLCVYGIIGFPTSKTELIDHLKSNIRLGLDLKNRNSAPVASSRLEIGPVFFSRSPAQVAIRIP